MGRYPQDISNWVMCQATYTEVVDFLRHCDVDPDDIEDALSGAKMEEILCVIQQLTKHLKAREMRSALPIGSIKMHSKCCI